MSTSLHFYFKGFSLRGLLKTAFFICYVLCFLGLFSSHVMGQNITGDNLIKQSELEKIDFSQDIDPDYQPTSDLEKKIWNEADKLEISFNKSNNIIDDPQLNNYVRQVLCKVIGDDRCAPIRLYLVRTTRFNALMAPNGMMQIWSGLLVRMENESQLAAILAHEYAHYVRRHSLQSFTLAENIEWTSSVPYVGLLASVSGVGSLFAFSREMEREADRLSLHYIHQAGYDPIAPSIVWERLTKEFEKTHPKLLERRKKNTSILGGFFSTHPSSEERLKVLRSLAENKTKKQSKVEDKNNYYKALSDWLFEFVNDEVTKKNYKTGEYLIEQIAKNGWNAELYFSKAELHRKRRKDGDLIIAAENYQKSIDSGSKRPETWRGLGLSLFRSKKKEEGKAALIEYLRLNPAAADSRMIRLLTGHKSDERSETELPDKDIIPEK